MIKDLEVFLSDKKIDFSISEGVVEIDGIRYGYIEPIDGKLFDSNFHLLVDRELSCDNYIFQFGGNWFYSPKGEENRPQLKRVRFLGKRKSVLENSSFLGIHGIYEVLNGSGQYSEWCKKAKFLGVSVLGICEKNSLAGVLKFQIECRQNGIRSVLGVSYTVYRPSEDFKYDLKCYVRDKKGWENLLLINKEVNVINNKYVTEDRLFELTEGLVFVIDPKSLPWDRINNSFLKKLLSVEYVFYQLDPIEYLDDTQDQIYLLNLQNFVNSDLEPISITDAYYIDKEDSEIKIRLNKIAGIFEYKSEDQYFKSRDEYFEELDRIFKNDGRTDDFFIRSIYNEQCVVSLCKFEIEQSGKHLPVYKMSLEQSLQHSSNEDLFWTLIIEGLQQRVPEHLYPIYLQRIGEEIEVIKSGNLIDYFLILWDIIKWSNENGILTGIGRGSAGGSLVAFCLRITHIDPIRFGLLFERFLNKGRVEGGSMPDVDCDFSGERRDEVKHYMEQRYGSYQVFSVGTYNTLKLKSAIKDLGRFYNIDIQTLNYITSIIDDSDGKYTEHDIELLFKNAVESKVVYSFVQENIDLVNDLILMINHPRNQSVHACATIILPEERDVFHWVPVKKIDMDGSSLLVSEWEGGELESIGLLKEDILGIRQLDKFQLIVQLIEKNRGHKEDIYNLPYDDEQVLEYFRRGWNQDVFHFGAKGLAGYCKLSKPDSLNDLIAAISLYRPGPIESNLHNEYVLRKDGEKEVEYLWGTENITKDTYGILIYQEQIMQVCVDVGGFSLVEADDIRKALGKMNVKYSAPYREKFIQGAVDRGCNFEEAEKIWELISKFALYSFNKSHAAAYTITGYICQWLKVHYPLEFWTAAFEYIDSSKKEERVTQFISEIQKTKSIKIVSSDINYSELKVHSDIKSNSIYWSLSSVKQVGDIAVSQILEERKKNGQYFSFEEFLDRHSFKGSKVNKSHIENLIYAGAFDRIENITNSLERIKLIQFYRNKRSVVIDKSKDEFTLASELVYKDWWWDIQQRRVSGISFFNYFELISEYIDDGSQYIEQDRIQLIKDDNSYYAIGGCIVDVIVRKSSKKGEYCSLLLESNYDYVWVTVFPDYYKAFVDSGMNFVDSKGQLLLVSGIIKYDDFKKENIMKVWDKSSIIILK